LSCHRPAGRTEGLSFLQPQQTHSCHMHFQQSHSQSNYKHCASTCSALVSRKEYTVGDHYYTTSRKDRRPYRVGWSCCLRLHVTELSTQGICHFHFFIINSTSHTALKDHRVLLHIKTKEHTSRVINNSDKDFFVITHSNIHRFSKLFHSQC